MKHWLVACAGLAALAIPSAAFAQAQARFEVEGLANCEKPNVRNYPIRVTGTARLSTDRRASVSAYSNVEGVSKYDVTLGGKPTEVQNGTASLRVRSQNSLRAVREYPNNTMTIDLRIVGSTCKLDVTHQLKPGKRQYTFQTPFGLSYCDRPITTKATCTGI